MEAPDLHQVRLDRRRTDKQWDGRVLREVLGRMDPGILPPVPGREALTRGNLFHLPLGRKIRNIVPQNVVRSKQLQRLQRLLEYYDIASQSMMRKSWVNCTRCSLVALNQ